MEPSPPSAIQDAIEATKRAIEIRASRHRKQVMLVVLLLFVSLLWALIRLSWLPLLLLLGLFPLIGLFVTLDIYLMRQWLYALNRWWAEDRLDPDFFVGVVTQMRMLPPVTLDGMLSLLPRNKILGRPSCRVPLSVRCNLADALHMIQGCQLDQTALTVLSTTVVLCSVAFALVWGIWELLGLALLGLPLVALIRVFRHRRLSRWRERLTQLSLPDQNLALNLARRLDWHPLSALCKGRWTASISAPPAPTVSTPASSG